MRPYYLQLNGRWQHLWLAGSGAPLLLLHGSPNQALMLRPLIERLAQQFLVIAPDTPGNGYSDPLPASQGEAEHYAANALELLSQLGVPRFAVYGFHTGATTAAELATRASAQVSAVVLDGYALWSDEEAAALDERYLAPIEPAADGSHLTAIWSRAIDQNLFFPWYDGRRQNAISYDLRELDRLHSRAMDFLNAGDAYRQAYRPALKADGGERLARLAATGVPTLVLAEASDVLAGHRERMPSALDLSYEIAADSATRLDRIEAFFRAEAPALLADGVHLPDSRRRYVRPRELPVAADEWLYVALPDAHPRRLWLHDLGQSHRRGASTDLRLDLPGHGYSTMRWPQEDDAVATILRETLAELDLADIAVAGRGLGQQLAEAMAGTTPAPASPPRVPDLSPSWEGAHLLRAWHYTRLRSQFRDWTAPHGATRAATDLPEPAVLHTQTLDLLRAGAATLNRLGDPIGSTFPN
ncbi:MAG: alpha/beta hydrolase [Pseudomonadota bacterium]